MLIDNNGDEVGDVEWRLNTCEGWYWPYGWPVILWNNYIISFAGLELTSRASFVYRDVFRINVQNLVEADEDAKFENAPDECLKVPRNNYKVKCIDRQWAQFYDENELRLEQNEGLFSPMFHLCALDLLIRVWRGYSAGQRRKISARIRRHLDVKLKYGKNLDTL